MRYGSLPEGISFHTLPEVKGDSDLAAELYELQKPKEAASFVTLNPYTFMRLDLRCGACVGELGRVWRFVFHSAGERVCGDAWMCAHMR